MSLFHLSICMYMYCICGMSVLKYNFPYGEKQASMKKKMAVSISVILWHTK